MHQKNIYRQIPSVHDLIQLPVFTNCTHYFSVRIAQKATQLLKSRIHDGTLQSIDSAVILDVLENEKKRLQTPKTRRVLNATGVVIHTNLGRAPIPRVVFEELQATLCGYSNLEMDLNTGKRGKRLQGIVERLCPLIGAEDVIVVNNNAAATLLAISACASPGEVLVSRGELVEIGGSFRIPDIIETGGCTLAEVGTTNRTRVEDYASRIRSDTRAIMRVHSSNFSIVGFTEQPTRIALARLAQDSNIPLIEDLGSGLLGKAPKIKDGQRLEEEESIQVALEEGADLVTFSGDKLLGGVQSGFIAGKKELVQRCAQHPLYRAMRLGKMSLLALETVLQFYVEGRQDELPVWKALQKSLDQCKLEAEMIMNKMGVGTVIPMQSFSGGGALPNQSIDSFGYFLPTPNCQKISDRLRMGTPSVLVRIQNNGLCIDPRTLLDGELEIILRVFTEVVSPLL